MADEKDLESHYRNKVMFITSLIAIYSIAGGSIPAEISLLGAKLTFKNPRYLELLAIVVMAFYWWRHRQYSSAIRGRMKVETYQSIVIPQWMCRKIETKGLHGRARDHVSDSGYKVSAQILKDGMQCYSAGAKWNRLFGINLWIKYVSKNDGEDPEYAEMQLDSWIDRILFIVWYWWAYITHAWVKPEFGDATLPSLAVHGALLSYAYNKLS